MLRLLEPLLGYEIEATDGEIGRVHDILFDDRSWKVRYLVVDTGKWLSGRRVLISTEVVKTPNWSSERVPVELTKKQIEESPDVDTKVPNVAYPLEGLVGLHAYYGWAPWWGAEWVPSPIPPAGPGLGETSDQAAKRGDPHLRGVREVVDYRIAAKDGDIGHVEDFIAELDDWVIRYLVIDTRNWIPGRKVLSAPNWVEDISWADRHVRMGMTKKQIEDSPKFDPSKPINREYELRLYDYYGRPVYWASSIGQ